VTQNDVLLLEIGPDYCCYATCDGYAKTISSISYATFDAFALSQTIDALLSEWKNADAAFQKIVVCSAFPKSLLFPAKWYHNGDAAEVLKNIYDVSGHQILKDEIKAGKMLNCYAVPQILHQNITGQYANVAFMHAYTAALKVDNGIAGENQIAVHFTPASFRVKVRKEQKLWLVQTFTYTTPLDVVYVLLKICTEFDMQQEATQVALSGLIDAGSHLYKELYNYFLHIHFSEPALYSLQQEQYPQHFFQSIYNLAACVL